MTVLFVLATIIFFLALDWFSRRVKEKKGVVVPNVQMVPSYPVRVPEGIFFTKSHTWLNLFPSGKVRLGVDDFIGRVVDKPQIILLKKNGESIARGEPLLTMKEDEHLLTVRSPIDGEIESANDELSRHPELLKDLLFSDGWAYTIKPQKFSELKGLLLGTETREWMREEFGRLRDFFAGVGQNNEIAPALLQDGGPPMAGVMKSMDDSVWQNFEHQFLTIDDSERA
jgi:glycine cleavage system H protein